jgi:hypothetical protein
MLNGPALALAVAGCQPQAIPLRRLLYRAIHLSWFDPFATARPLFTRPGVRSRYLPAGAAGAPETLYSAFEADTAYREFNQDYFQAAQTPQGVGLIAAGVLRPEPGAVIGVQIDATRLLDVRDAAVQNLLNTNPAELAASWKNVRNATATQQLGEAVFLGNWFEGIVYHSVQHPGFSCVVLFRQRLLANPGVHFRGHQAGNAPNPNSNLADARLP